MHLGFYQKGFLKGYSNSEKTEHVQNLNQWCIYNFCCHNWNSEFVKKLPKLLVGVSSSQLRLHHCVKSKHCKKRFGVLVRWTSAIMLSDLTAHYNKELQQKTVITKSNNRWVITAAHCCIKSHQERDTNHRAFCREDHGVQIMVWYRFNLHVDHIRRLIDSNPWV